MKWESVNIFISLPFHQFPLLKQTSEPSACLGMTTYLHFKLLSYCPIHTVTVILIKIDAIYYKGLVI